MAPRWRLFAGVTIIVLVVVLGLSRATARELTRSGETTGADAEPAVAGEERSLEDRPHARGDGVTTGSARPEASGTRESGGSLADDPDLRVGAAASQALVGGLLAGFAWYAGVPPDALGIDDPRGALLPGIALGIGLYAANEAGAALADRQGVGADESLRELLAPETRGEWALLLLVVLPVVAGVEELLFRGALVGALAAGFPVSPWLLAVLSSVAFGLGHGLQGPGGILVTGALGFVLATAFIITGSLWVVVVAHYLVNALEFVVHEGIGVG